MCASARCEVDCLSLSLDGLGPEGEPPRAVKPRAGGPSFEASCLGRNSAMTIPKRYFSFVKLHMADHRDVQGLIAGVAWLASLL